MHSGPRMRKAGSPEGLGRGWTGAEEKAGRGSCGIESFHSSKITLGGREAKTRSKRLSRLQTEMIAK